MTTLPGRAVGAAGANTGGENEFGPPGVKVGAFSVGVTGAPVDDGADELADGELLVGSAGFSLSLLQAAIVDAMPATASPATTSPILRVQSL